MVSRRRPAAAEPSRATIDPTRISGLAALGARPGENVRWQDRPGGRWHGGAVSHRELDGSVAVIDDDGRARSLLAERLWVQSSGSRGGRRWEALPQRAARGEQLCLFA